MQVRAYWARLVTICFLQICTGAVRGCLHFAGATAEVAAAVSICLDLTAYASYESQALNASSLVSGSIGVMHWTHVVTQPDKVRVRPTTPQPA